MIANFRQLIFSLFLVVCACCAQANTESRLALLIGNASYKASPLTNPVNDVRLMEKSLKEAGFTVIKAENASIREMRRLVREFGDRLKASGGVGLFYFAGHGVQVRGENYLISTDSDIRNEDEVQDDSVSTSLIMEKMQSAGNRMNLVVLDACRNNPFAVKSRSALQGLAAVSAPSGTLVAYSTSPGSVASDGTGNNGVYTEELARVMRTEGMPIEEVFKQVRTAVRRVTNNQQTPWENTALEGQFYFRPLAPVVAIAPAAAPVPAISAPNTFAAEMALWDTVKNSTTPSELKAYLGRYPKGNFADVASARISALESLSKDRAAADQITNANQAAKARADQAALDLAFWDNIKSSTSPNEIQSYISQYPNGIFVGLATAKIQELKAVRTAPAPMVADPRMMELTFWESIKTSQNAAELQSYVKQFPDGAFVALANARISNINQPRASDRKPTTMADTSAGVIGVLTLQEKLGGLKQDISVERLVQADGSRIYSNGDIVLADGRLVQVRIGGIVVKIDSGSLWKFPLSEGQSGIAQFPANSTYRHQGGQIKWKVTADGADRWRIEAGASYTLATITPAYMFGGYEAWYASSIEVPERFDVSIRGPQFASGGYNLLRGTLVLK